MSRYDGLIIPRSYSEYINKTDAATLQQALQLSGVLSGTVAAGDNKAVKSSAVYNAILEKNNFRTVLNINKSKTPNSKYAFFGDSITYGKTRVRTAAGSISEEVQAVENYPVVFCKKAKAILKGNYGVSGSSIATISGRAKIKTQLEQYLASCSDCDAVFFAGGMNDFGSNVSLATFKEAVIDTFTYIKNNYNNDVIILGIWNSYGYNVNYNDTPTHKKSSYTQILYEEALNFGFSFIDTSNYSPAYDPSTLSNLSVYTFRSDGLHPTVAGYRIIGEKLCEDVLGIKYAYGNKTVGAHYTGEWDAEYIPIFSILEKDINIKSQYMSLNLAELDKCFCHIVEYSGYVKYGDGLTTRQCLPFYNPESGAYCICTVFDEQNKAVGIRSAEAFVNNGRCTPIFKFSIESRN